MAERDATIMRPAIILLAIPLMALALFGSSNPPSASAAPTPECGPGAHWIDDPSQTGAGVPCPVGTDNLANTGAIVGIDNTGDCVKDFNVTLSGPTTIDRSVGQGTSTPHSIDTEIVSMSLTGGTFTLRAGAGGSPALSASDGKIEEQAGDNTKADSFFDVFFEIDTGTQKLYNQAALKLKAVILQVPPDQTYIHEIPGNCLDLFDAPTLGNDTGANLVEASHDPDPPPVGGIALVDSSGSPAGPAAGSGSSALPYAALAGAVAAGALALAAGGWYARRRFRQ